MLGAGLLRLYPPAWRERYGEEFLAMVGPGALRAQQVLNIVSGAIDAWLSADVRRATVAPNTTGKEGGSMMLKALVCPNDQTASYTTRDGLIGAGVMLGSTALFTTIGLVARRNGWPATGQMLLNFGFMFSLTLSMPFWALKGQPWKAQAVIVGGTLALLLGIGCLV
jgi:hypothetical protein